MDKKLASTAFLRVPGFGFGASPEMNGGMFLRADVLKSAQLAKGGSKVGAKDGSGETREGLASSSRSSGISSNQSGALFQKIMGRVNTAGGKDDSTGDRGSREHGDEVTVVLFDARPAAAGSPAPAQVTKPLSPELDSQVQQIYEKIVSRMDAAKRPGPVVSNAPVNFNIPVDAGSQGLHRLEVSFSDSQVTVKLFFPAGEAGQNLVNAAGQLGHLLQGHLPNRRIKIVQAISQSEENGEKVYAENEFQTNEHLVRSRPSSGGA
ncbi:hypothetical protein FIV00_25815 [Labrenzia sp. THAF82]|uniref:hypothetical protein n=1 Tax=Labrenzia sp. THAF82 TaxID=2587861 RepID=UPI001268785C|nr:hypothetical protein [Labrenzia sp. THAF82]QFT33939.1 hypothetical protein FIV00_25815 [Labrenzia sp. THAF82]